jgi:hypothetical protein
MESSLVAVLVVVVIIVLVVVIVVLVIPLPFPGRNVLTDHGVAARAASEGWSELLSGAFSRGPGSISHAVLVLFVPA